jgi:hypothetical protein
VCPRDTNRTHNCGLVRLTLTGDRTLSWARAWIAINYAGTLCTKLGVPDFFSAALLSQHEDGPTRHDSNDSLGRFIFGHLNGMISDSAKLDDGQSLRNKVFSGLIGVMQQNSDRFMDLVDVCSIAQAMPFARHCGQPHLLAFTDGCVLATDRHG